MLSYGLKDLLVYSSNIELSILHYHDQEKYLSLYTCYFHF